MHGDKIGIPVSWVICRLGVPVTFHSEDMHPYIVAEVSQHKRCTS